jgi:hypothetical protein
LTALLHIFEPIEVENMLLSVTALVLWETETGDGLVVPEEEEIEMLEFTLGPPELDTPEIGTPEVEAPEELCPETLLNVVEDCWVCIPTDDTDPVVCPGAEVPDTKL